MQNQNELTSEIKETQGIVQQINFAKYVSIQENIYLSFNQIVCIASFIFVLIVGNAIYSCIVIFGINNSISKLQSHETQLKETLNSPEIKKLKEITLNSRIYLFLKDQHTKNSPGFSTYLEILSDTCPTDAWLTNIDIDKRKNNVKLTGKSYALDNASLFVDDLNKKSLFKNDPFTVEKIDKTNELTRISDKEQKLLYVFTLQSGQKK